MLNPRSAVACALVAIGLWSCAPSGSFPPPIPSPVAEWTISLAQSGGFAGVNLLVRVDSDGTITAHNGRSGGEVTLPLSKSDLQEVERLLVGLELKSPNGARSACADCFLYDLEISLNGRTTRWQGDDTTLHESGVEDLIWLLGRLRDQALTGAF
jgi:hypothetical protein